MWRPATAQDIGKKCRVRDNESEAWQEGKLDVFDAAHKYPFWWACTGWKQCEVWDEPRTEITWENTGSRIGMKYPESYDGLFTVPVRKAKDRYQMWNGGKWVSLTIQQPKPKTVITKQMILEKFHVSDEDANIVL